MNAPLYELAEEYRALMECEDEDLDERLEDLGDALNERLERIAMAVRMLDLQQVSALAEAKRLQERAASLGRRQDRLERAALNAMAVANKKKVEGSLFTVTRVKGSRRIEAPDVDKLPDWAVRPPKPGKPTPDKKALGEAFAAARQNGELLEGVHMDEEGNVTIDGAQEVIGDETLRIR